MQLSAVDLNLLVALDALLQERSVARAARRVGLSASAMSHALARLRETLDDPILVRSGRAMVPTARAESLTEQVRRAVLEAEKVFSAQRRFDPSDIRRRFRVAASDMALVVLAPALEHILITEAPGADVAYQPLTDLASHLREGICDLVLGPFGAMPRDIRSRVLFRDRLVCVVREDAYGPGKRLELDELVAMPHVEVEGNTPTGPMDEALARLELQRRVARTVPSLLAALHLVASSDHVATVPISLAHVLQRSLRLRVLMPPLQLDTLSVGFAWHVRSHDDPEHRWLREAVERAVDLSV